MVQNTTHSPGQHNGCAYWLDLAILPRKGQGQGQVLGPTGGSISGES